jgi:predicted nucleic acid-binding protein
VVRIYYLDANVFIYAYSKPRKGKKLSDKIKWFKREAKKIIKILNYETNSFCISKIQFSEVVNLLKGVMNWQKLQMLIMGLISNNSLEIMEMKKLMYINAVEKMKEFVKDANDISAYLLMREKEY